MERFHGYVILVHSSHFLVAAIFLKKMRESGVCDIVFYPPDEAFKQKFNMAGPVKFAKHAELDMFVMHLLAVEPKFAELYNQEWKLYA